MIHSPSRLPTARRHGTVGSSSAGSPLLTPARRSPLGVGDAPTANTVLFEHDEAIRHINLAMRFQPLHPPFFKNILSAAYLAKNDLVPALSTAKQTIELAPADITARLILTSAYVRSDRQDLSKDIAAEIKDLDPSFSIKRFAGTQYYRSSDYIAQLASELQLAGLPD